jgi:zinc protease
MKLRRHHPVLCRSLLALLLASVSLTAQQSFDRSRIPPAGKTPALKVPQWTKSTLANGAALIVSERHDLPLVSFKITFLGGSYQAETESRRGLADLTSAMMSEGTRTRNGEAVVECTPALGTSIRGHRRP